MHSSCGTGLAACSTSTFLLRISSASKETSVPWLPGRAVATDGSAPCRAARRPCRNNRRDAPRHFSRPCGHVVDITPVPDRLEQWIGKAKGQMFCTVLCPGNGRYGRFEILESRWRVCGSAPVPTPGHTDRFLNDNSRPFPVGREAGIVYKARDFTKQEGAWPCRKCVGLWRPLLFQACAQVAELRIGCVSFEIALQISDMQRELLPLLDGGFPAAGEPFDSLVQALAQASSLSATRSTAIIAK